MYKLVWDGAIKRKKMTDGDRILQSLYVQYLTGVVTKKSQLVKLSGSSLAFAPSVAEMDAFGLDASGLASRYADLLRELDAEAGHGPAASRMLEDFGPAGYNMQYKLNLRTIDNSKELYYGELLKIKNLLKSVGASGTAEEKAHYQSLLFNIEDALE
jgi:hypothetical protein